MQSDSIRKRIWLFIFSGCMIVFGFLGRVLAGVYLMSYEDHWRPQDGQFLTLESMTKNEWVIYILGAYVTPLMMLCGILVGVWLLWKIYRN